MMVLLISRRGVAAALLLLALVTQAESISIWALPRVGQTCADE